ncbi:hypothetical protein ACFL6X_02260 [Candidatus Latescibacterota bacterium]
MAPYEKARPGFELIRTDVCEEGLLGEDFRDAGEGYFEVCVWDIWHWAKGEKKGRPLPDPAQEDRDKRAIDAMQVALGTLSEEDRLIRIQSACLTRCYCTYPGNIDLVLDGIARGRPNVSQHISCEPPWSHSLLPLLRRRYGHRGGRDDQSHERRSLVRAYATTLDAYLVGGSLADLQEVLPDHAELAVTTYARLGDPTLDKLLQVTRLRNALTLWSFAGGSHPHGFKHATRVDEILANAVGPQPPEDGELTKLIAKLHNGLCHQFFFRRLDHLIAHVGADKRCDLPGAGQGREFVIGTLVNYVHSLGSWLADRTIDQGVKIWPPSEETLRAVFRTLGERSPRKRWLVSCLWKNLQEIQAWAGRGALDEEPERFVLPEAALAVEGS